MADSRILEQPKAPALLKVVFAFSGAVPGQMREQLRPLLEGRGGTSAGLGDDNITHVISPTLDFAERAELETRKIAIVTPQWAEACAKLNLLCEPRAYSADPRMFMSGCVICTTGLPPSDDLNCQAITEHFGGQFRATLTREVTHLIAGKATGDKYQRAVKFGPTIGISIVMPEWIWESFKVRRLIRTGPFLYPAPPNGNVAAVLQGGSTSSDYSKSAIIAASPERKPKGAKFDDALLEASLAAAPDADSVFVDGPVVYLSSELLMDPKFALAVRERVVASGASACYLATGGSASREKIREQLGHLDAASIVICQQRKGWEYWRAAEEHKTIGNLTWLISIFATGVYTAPMAQPLHYPLPPVPIPGFDKLVITVGSYRETARTLITRNITSLGATHSGAANAATTHYILADETSAKAKHGRQNNKPVVNHFWIDACLCKWRMVDPASDPRFLRFGPLTDLNSVVGTTELTEDDVDGWMSTEAVGLERESALKMIEFDDEPTVADSEVDDDDDDLAVETMAMARHAKRSVVRPAPPARDATSDDELANELGAGKLAGVPDVTDQLNADEDDDDEDEPVPAPSDVLSLRPPLGPGLTSPSQHASLKARSSKPAIPKPTVTQTNADEEDDEATEDEDDMVVDAVVPPPVVMDEDGEEEDAMAVDASKKATESADDSSDDGFFDGPSKAATKTAKGKAPAKPRASTSALDTPVSNLASASTSSSSGRVQRRAAAKGAAALSDMAGMQLQADLLRARERKGTSIAMNEDGTVRKRGSSSVARPTSSRVKRIKLDEGASSSSPAAAGKRKRRSSSVDDAEPEGEVRVAWSGIDTLIEGRRDEEVIARLGEIGIILDKADIANATHFVLPNLMRTVAVLQAIPNAPHFVKTEWVKACLDKSKLVSAKAHQLTDPESKAVEKKNKVKLTEILARARAFQARDAKLLDGHSFFVTPRVQAIEPVKLVVRANGGQILDFMPEAVDDHTHVITDKLDKALWPPEGKVYLPELVFASVFAQEFSLDAHVCKIR